MVDVGGSPVALSRGVDVVNNSIEKSNYQWSGRYVEGR